RLVADQQPRRNMRMRRDQAPHERRGGVVGGCRAEDDLIAGIVEVEGRTQRLFDMVFHAADRPHETDAGDVGRRARAIPRSPCARSGSPEIARQSDLYRVPEIVTLGRLPGEGESDSRWRTKEVRHVGSDTLTPGF